MKLTYIYHSCYLIEGEKFDVIIDYFRDTKPDGIVHERVNNSTKKLYVLSSHSHNDHFNPEILIWGKNNSNIEYIFSSDILDEGFACLNDATYIDKMESYTNDNLKVKAFGSTDIGISFLIEMDDKQLFHAGDLNNWHWNEESTIEEARDAELKYLEELELIAQHVSNLDLVIFPVDDRLGKDYMKGAEQFVERIPTALFVPMHFGERYNKAAAFKPIAIRNGAKFFSPTLVGESLEF